MTSQSARSHWPNFTSAFSLLAQQKYARSDCADSASSRRPSTHCPSTMPSRASTADSLPRLSRPAGNPAHVSRICSSQRPPAATPPNYGPETVATSSVWRHSSPSARYPRPARERLDRSSQTLPPAPETSRNDRSCSRCRLLPRPDARDNHLARAAQPLGSQSERRSGTARPPQSPEGDDTQISPLKSVLVSLTFATTLPERLGIHIYVHRLSHRPRN